MARLICEINGRGKKFKVLQENWPSNKHILIDVATGEKFEFDTFKEVSNFAVNKIVKGV